MTNTNANMVELQRAIKQFGSLKAAIEALERKKQALETEISELTKNIELMKKKETQVIHNIKHTERIYEQRERELHALQDTIEKNRVNYDEYVTDIRQFLLQYQLFESFITMLRTSPSTKESIRDLARTLLLLIDIPWYFQDQPDKLRWLFVHTVLGENLYCYYCNRCGLKFIANQKVQSQILGYHCPNCRLMSSMKEDDSFLKAMLSYNEHTEIDQI